MAEGTLSKEDQLQIQKVEDTLINLADSMYNSYIPDERPEYCQKFVKHLLHALKVPYSYEYAFDRLGKKINIISSDDKAFRIFNWYIVQSETSLRYYGAIQVPSEELKLYPLIDYTNELKKGEEDSILTNGKWFGALYYKIIPNDYNGGKIYSLLGLNASSPISNKKVIEPLQFTDKGIVFGAPIFDKDADGHTGGHINRFIMEYKKEVQASLNWDDEKKMIYFDKLISQVNDPHRKYTFVPSGEYDGFRWEYSQWNYITDLIPVKNLKDGEAPTPDPVKGKE